mmetsp:Transcript_2376/g.3296  ORF Transcript_2376/g.3296 Transcript_2376/m.3296 type:complete len:202 (-) Transcript_2376:535-1140(-)
MECVPARRMVVTLGSSRGGMGKYLKYAKVRLAIVAKSLSGSSCTLRSGPSSGIRDGRSEHASPLFIKEVTQNIHVSSRQVASFTAASASALAPLDVDADVSLLLASSETPSESPLESFPPPPPPPPVNITSSCTSFPFATTRRESASACSLTRDVKPATAACHLLVTSASASSSPWICGTPGGRVSAAQSTAAAAAVSSLT